MKRLLVMCFLVLGVLPAFAQMERSPGLINRLGGQQVDDAGVARLVHTTTESPIVQNTADVVAPLTLVLLDSNRVELIQGDVIIIDADIYNNTGADIRLNFFRTHLSIPLKWESSICFGTNCYAARTDSLSPEEAVEMPAGNTPINFHLNLYCPKGSHADSVVDYIKFFIQGGGAGDTASSYFTGVLKALSSVEQQKEALIGQPKIVSLYPSPLVDGSSIKVKVSAPREMNFSYSIYDEVGRQVAFGTTHQRLIQGDNTCQIGELNGLANGSYQVKFTFGDGSIDTRSFQIAH